MFNICSFSQGQVPCLYVPALYAKHQAPSFAKTIDSIMFCGLEKKNESLIDLMHTILICFSSNCSFLFVCLYFGIFFFFFWLKHVRSHFPNQELNPYPPPTLGAQSLNYLLDHKGSPSKLFLWLNFISLSIFYLFQVKSLLYTSL